MFQEAVTATVAAAMSQINSGGSSGSGSGGQRLNPNGSQGHQKECSYNDFMSEKRTSVDENGCVISLNRWFEKIKSIFEICACSETNKVKFAACTFTDKP